MNAVTATTPTIPDVGIWQQLGPVGGVLAFIVTCLWLYREYSWAKREAALVDRIDKTLAECKATTERQWLMITDLVKTTSKEFTEALETSTQAWSSVKTFMEARLRDGNNS